MIGAAGLNGTVTTSQITYLNAATWAALVTDPVQVAAITGAEISSFNGDKITALGLNIHFLTDSALNALTYTGNAFHTIGQIQAITAAQIATLTPAQVRMIGAAGPNGTVITSQITRLNADTWAALVSDPAQVSAITGIGPLQSDTNEIATLNGDKITAIGLNIRYLTDAALNALTYTGDAFHTIGQIQAITAAQIATLTPAQVRMIGAAGPNGTVITSQITYLNTATWAALVSDPAQVSAITGIDPSKPNSNEIATLNGDKITALGLNIQYLSNFALSALTYTGNAFHTIGQIQAITAAQVAVLTPAQISVIA